MCGGEDRGERSNRGPLFWRWRSRVLQTIFPFFSPLRTIEKIRGENFQTTPFPPPSRRISDPQHMAQTLFLSSMLWERKSHLFTGLLKAARSKPLLFNPRGFFNSLHPKKNTKLSEWFPPSHTLFKTAARSAKETRRKKNFFLLLACVSLSLLGSVMKAAVFCPLAFFSLFEACLAHWLSLWPYCCSSLLKSRARSSLLRDVSWGGRIFWGCSACFHSMAAAAAVSKGLSCQRASKDAPLKRNAVSQEWTDWTTDVSSEKYLDKKKKSQIQK